MDLTAGIRGKGVLVTGAASGVGLAAARLLAGMGVSRLVLSDINADGLKENTRDLGVETILVPGDIAREDFWASIGDALDQCDKYILNAGISHVKPIERMEFAEWQRIIAINLGGSFLGIRAAMMSLRKRGQPGAIAVTGSSAGIRVDKLMTAYGVSKAGVHHLVRVCANEGAPDRIRVNAVAPGGIATPNARLSGNFRRTVERLGSEEAAFEEIGRTSIPIGRYTQAEEIAHHLIYLNSDVCGTMTGTILLNDGGFTL